MQFLINGSNNRASQANFKYNYITIESNEVFLGTGRKYFPDLVGSDVAYKIVSLRLKNLIILTSKNLIILTR